MIIFKHATDLHAHFFSVKKNKKTIGFVPTMGALHQGHLSLIAESRKTCDVTVCSIFINPAQFNNKEDFQKYPVTVENDILLLEESGCDVLFMPDEKEIYPDKASKNKHYDIGYLENILEGKYRPGHFQGVSLVMDKLLHIMQADYLFLGQKDFQQCLVIKKLISILGMQTQVVVCPVMRTESGLAMSSRNMRLSNEEKETASFLHKTLYNIAKSITVKKFSILKQEALASLAAKGFTTDYLELAHSNNLSPANENEVHKGIVILIAAFINKVRLIDNLLITG